MLLEVTQMHSFLCYAMLSHFSRVRLCDPIDGSPPGSPIPGILQARTLEWVAMSFSNAWKWKWSHSVMSDSYRPHGLQPIRLLCPWDFLGKSTGVECHCLLLKMCGIQLKHCLEGRVQLKCLNQKKEIHQVRLTVSSISFSVIGG